jgi:WD40 repeat protein
MDLFVQIAFPVEPPLNDLNAVEIGTDQPLFDAFGDELPSSALARLGTKRFRHYRLSGVAISEDGSKVASCANDGTIRIWSRADGKELTRIHAQNVWFDLVTFSPDGRKIAAANTHTSQIHLWDTQRGKLLATLDKHSCPVTSIAFSPDGAKIASSSRNADESGGEVRIWDAATGRHLKVLDGFPTSCRSIAFQPESENLALGLFKGPGLIVDSLTEKRIRDFGNAESKGYLALSRNGKLLACDTKDGGIEIWNTVTGETVRSFPSEKSYVKGLGFCGDDKILVG